MLVAGEEQPAQPGFDVARSAAMVLAVVQGAALHWRRKRPELVMGVVLASGFAGLPSGSRPGGGVVVGTEIDIVVDVQAILREGLESTGAIEYYRSIGALPEQRA